VAPGPVITELVLRPAAPPLRYLPGQYVLLGDPAAELVVRSFSIANAPRRDGLISPPVTPGTRRPALALGTRRAPAR
jgi:CDP-4-dehydro-6-deoxyglucose reductase